MLMERQFIYRELKHIDLGLIDYAEAWDMQKSLMEERKQNNIPDTLLLLEHPNTYTLGKVTDKDKDKAINSLKSSGETAWEIGKVELRQEGSEIVRFLV